MKKALELLKKHRNKLVPVATGLAGVVGGEQAKSCLLSLFSMLGL